MNLSFSQILFILFIGFLLFGNLPLKVQELSKYLQNFLTQMNTQKKEAENAETKKEISKSEEKKEK
jgi:Sec-independent protein translocase protein TatA